MIHLKLDLSTTGIGMIVVRDSVVVSPTLSLRLSVHRARRCLMEVSRKDQSVCCQSCTSPISPNRNMSVHEKIAKSVSFLVTLYCSDEWVCFVLVCVVELNMSARGCGGSSSSLPGTPGGEAAPANSVLSWAVSFEKLLEDPAGVRQFTVRCPGCVRTFYVQAYM